MARLELPPERLSAYERAVCYYTLPRVTHPVTVGLIAVFTVCLLEATGMLVYGLAWDAPRWTQLGCWTLGGVAVAALVTFMARALLNEVRMRRALAIARTVPDAISAIDDIPDPFADHVLLRHPLHARGDLFPCTDNEGAVVYFVESAPTSAWWKVKDAHDNEVLRVHAGSGAGSFSLGAVPARLTVLAGGEEVARIRRRFTFGAPLLVVECLRPDPRKYVVQRGAIYRHRKPVGRIYYLHHSLYLDIHRDDLHPAVLALFAVMT